MNWHKGFYRNFLNPQQTITNPEISTQKQRKINAQKVPKCKNQQNKMKVGIEKNEENTGTCLRLFEKRQENLPLHLSFCCRKAHLGFRVLGQHDKTAESVRVDGADRKAVIGGRRVRSCAIFASPSSSRRFIFVIYIIYLTFDLVPTYVAFMNHAMSATEIIIFSWEVFSILKI